MILIEFAVYDLSTGKIKSFKGGYDTIIVDDNEGYLVDCPRTATHVINGEPVEIVPQPTVDEIKLNLTSAVQIHLDNTVKARGYDGILSAASYATSNHPKFSAEGIAAVEWRDAVWSYCYQVLDDVTNGLRPIPTADELISELPIIEW